MISGLKNIFKTSIQANKFQTLSSLQTYNFARKSKHGYNIVVDEDKINVKDVKYAFDQEESDVYNPEKPNLFYTTLKRKQAESLKKKEFILYQQQMKAQAEEALNKFKKTSDKQTQKEFLWDQGVPPERPYDKVDNKELNYIYRDSKYFERSDKNISYLQAFQQPFTIHDQQIRDAIDFIKNKITVEKIQNSSVQFIIEDEYRKDPEILQKFDELKSLIKLANYKLLPTIGLALSFELRYKIDFAGVWSAYLETLEKNMHHYTPLEMAQIKYALNTNYPKIGNPALHKSFLDILIPELHLCNIQELLHLFQAFRNLRQDKIQTKIMNEIINRRNEIKNPDDFANIIYSYASCRLKKQNRKKLRIENEEKIEANKIVGDIFLQNLRDSIPNMTTDAVVRLSLALCILRLPSTYPDLLSRIEQNLLKNAESIDSINIAQVMYAFSKMQNNIPYGSPEFYAKFYGIIESKFDEFTNMEKSKILYAYSCRKQISEAQFTKLYLPWISKEMPNLCYSELHYVAYSLMFNKVTDKNIWKKFVHNIAQQEFNCPVSSYLPIKYARYYMDTLFPEWNYEPLEQACRAAEYSFNTLRIKNTHLDDSLIEFGQILVNKLNVDIKMLVEFDNLLIVDFAVLPEKVAILYQHKKFQQYDNPQISLPQIDLRAYILEQNGWGVLNVNQEEFAQQGLEKNTWLKNKFEEVYNKQVELYKEQQGDRWGELIGKIEKIGENATLPSEAHKERGITVEWQQ